MVCGWTPRAPLGARPGLRELARHEAGDARRRRARAARSVRERPAVRAPSGSARAGPRIASTHARVPAGAAGRRRRARRARRRPRLGERRAARPHRAKRRAWIRGSRCSSPSSSSTRSRWRTRTGSSTAALTPSNVVVTARGTRAPARLRDAPGARPATPSTLLRARVSPFMAPEQRAALDRPSSVACCRRREQSDVWSVGACLHFAICRPGRPTSELPSLRRAVPEAAEDVAAVVDRALADRSARALRERLRDARRHPPRDGGAQPKLQSALAALAFAEPGGHAASTRVDVRGSGARRSSIADRTSEARRRCRRCPARPDRVGPASGAATSCSVAAIARHRGGGDVRARAREAGRRPARGTRRAGDVAATYLGTARADVDVRRRQRPGRNARISRGDLVALAVPAEHVRAPLVERDADVARAEARRPATSRSCHGHTWSRRPCWISVGHAMRPTTARTRAPGAIDLERGAQRVAVVGHEIGPRGSRSTRSPGARLDQVEVGHRRVRSAPRGRAARATTRPSVSALPMTTSPASPSRPLARDLHGEEAAQREAEEHDARRASRSRARTRRRAAPSQSSKVMSCSCSAPVPWPGSSAASTRVPRARRRPSSTARSSPAVPVKPWNATTHGARPAAKTSSARGRASAAVAMRAPAA